MIIKQKSEFNIDAAELLFNKNLYAPSVHCSYYSCLQLLKYIVKHFFGVEYKDLASQIQLSQKGSHEYIFEYVQSEMKGKFSIEEERKFSRNFKDLKTFRIKSDYEDIEIDNEKSEKAYNIAIEIRQFLQKGFI